MELIVINESQIKLTLTPADLDRYPPDAEEGALFRAILRDACRMGEREGGTAPIPAGFADRGGKLFVQMYPSRRGGCELFVTRLPPARASLDGDGIPDRSAAGENALGTDTRSRRYPSPSVSERRAVYRFGELALLLRCCSALSRTMAGDGLEESAAFADRDRRSYYLVLPGEVPFVSEYLGALCPGGTFSYIHEHCDPICGGNAVRTLGELA